MSKFSLMFVYTYIGEGSNSLSCNVWTRRGGFIVRGVRGFIVDGSENTSNKRTKI